MEYQLYQYVLLTATGALAGVLGGMLGIGGSVIMIPAMVITLGAEHVGADGVRHDDTHQYMAAAMIVNFLLSVPSVWAHWRKRAIWPGVVKFLAPGGLLGVLLGVWVSRHLSGQYIRWFLGLFFVYVSAENFYRAFRGPRPDRAGRHEAEGGSWIPKFSLGGVVGFFAGMTGLGGGALAVPGQQYVLNIPIRNAIANSSAMIAAVAWLGAITKNLQLASHPELGSVTVSLALSGCLAVTAVVGSYIGGHLTHALPVRAVRATFALMILASLPKMFEGFGALFVVRP